MKNLKIALYTIIMGVLISACKKSSTINPYITTTSGLQYMILKQGMGASVSSGQEILIHESTRYQNDSLVFSSRDNGEPLKILVGGNQVIKGLDEGVVGMKVGEVRKLIVPPALSKRTGEVRFPHPDSTLVYEVELIDIVQKQSILPEKGQVIPIDTLESSIKWTGFYALKLDKHFGTVKFKKGNWVMHEGMITGGEFLMDMETITNTDGKYNEMLVDHLKNEDFFETSVYPLSKLKINRIDYSLHPKFNIEAELTIKGITQPIEFTGEFNVIKGQTVFTSKISINRTRWNIKYGSGSFYDNLGDDVISDTIEFDVIIYAIPRGC